MSQHLVVCSNNLMLLEAASQASGGTARITVLESGLQVLATVDVVHADLLILDLETPGINALLLTSAIRALAPALPILAVSTLPSGVGRDLSHKGVSFLPLPARPDAWAQALGRVLDDLGPRDARERNSLPAGAGAQRE
jgi:CheY-like chemotaxis protein